MVHTILMRNLLKTQHYTLNDHIISWNYYGTPTLDTSCISFAVQLTGSPDTCRLHSTFSLCVIWMENLL